MKKNTMLSNKPYKLLLLIFTLFFGSIAYAQSTEDTQTLTNNTELTTQTGNVKSLPENSINKETPSHKSVSLPHNLSPWGMFMTADVVVKTVMIGLTIVALLTWIILVSKSIELSALKRLLKSNLAHLSAAQSLSIAINNKDIKNVGHELTTAADEELKLSSDILEQGGHNQAIKDGIKERIDSRLSRIEASSTRKILVGIGLLATIGAISPFVGLFGTVWGIMDSFISIAESHTTNLAVVAPGIAEALLATALGLVAAIPAVVIYNHFARKMAEIKALILDGSAAIMRLVSRDLDRHALDKKNPSILATEQ